MAVPQGEMAARVDASGRQQQQQEEGEEGMEEEEGDLGITEDNGDDELLDPRLAGEANGTPPDGESDQAEHEQPVLAFDIEPTPAIFTSQGFRRIFIVTAIDKARGAHRPSFEFQGYIIGFEGPVDRATEYDSVQTGVHVVASGLTLSLRYEPPSPKFGSKCPGLTSYRLKVSRGSEFLYSMRGLPQQMWVDRAARVAVWGKLELAFASQAELARFLETLKHVDVAEEDLLGDSALRILDPLWEAARDSAPGEAGDQQQQPEPLVDEQHHKFLSLSVLSSLEGAAPGLSYALVAVAAAAAGFAAGYLIRSRQG